MCLCDSGQWRRKYDEPVSLAHASRPGDVICSADAEELLYHLQGGGSLAPWLALGPPPVAELAARNAVENLCDHVRRDTTMSRSESKKACLAAVATVRHLSNKLFLKLVDEFNKPQILADPPEVQQTKRHAKLIAGPHNLTSGPYNTDL